MKLQQFEEGYAPHSGEARQGFEVILKTISSETEEIVDTTNHVPGKQPLYPRHESGVDL